MPCHYHTIVGEVVPWRRGAEKLSACVELDFHIEGYGKNSVQDGQLRRITLPHYICRSCFFKFRQIRSIRRSLHLMLRRHWWTRLWQAVRTTVTCCNLLYHGIAARVKWTDCSENRLWRHWSFEIRPYHSGSSCSASGAFRGNINWTMPPFGRKKISFGQ